MRSTKIIKNCSSSLCTCLHHMVIIGSHSMHKYEYEYKHCKNPSYSILILFWCGFSHIKTNTNTTSSNITWKINKFAGFVFVFAHMWRYIKTDFAYEYEHSKIPLIFIIIRPFLFVIEFWIEGPDIWPPWSLASILLYLLRDLTNSEWVWWGQNWKQFHWQYTRKFSNTSQIVRLSLTN